tara:strand:- start:10387 stop:11547 length:1161 start_codon:yes stop_codon:yes gene_type:complete
MTQPPRKQSTNEQDQSHSLDQSLRTQGRRRTGLSDDARQQAERQSPDDVYSAETHRQAPPLPKKIGFGKLLRAGALTVVPLKSSRLLRKKPAVKIGHRQLTKGKVVITEVGQQGFVPRLRAENRTKFFVLLIEGDQLLGAKQNRICNSTVLLKPNAVSEIPVSCVEEGRWQHVSKNFSSSNFHAAPTLRRRLAESKKHTRQASHGQRAHESNQTMVWNEVQEFASCAGVHSETQAMEEVFEKSRERQPVQQRLECPKNTNGWILAIDGRVVSVDLFGTPKLCRQAWDRMVHSAAMEAQLLTNRRLNKKARQNTGKPNLHSARDSDTPHFDVNKPKHLKSLLRLVHSTHLEPVAAVCGGTEQRFDGSQFSGSYLTLDNRLVHLGISL